MKIRWKRVGILLLTVVILISGPRVSRLVGNARLRMPEFPDIVPCLFPSAAEHDGLRAVLILSVAALCLILVTRELLQE